MFNFIKPIGQVAAQMPSFSHFSVSTVKRAMFVLFRIDLMDQDTKPPKADKTGAKPVWVYPYIILSIYSAKGEKQWGFIAGQNIKQLL